MPISRPRLRDDEPIDLLRLATSVPPMAIPVHVVDARTALRSTWDRRLTDCVTAAGALHVMPSSTTAVLVDTLLRDQRERSLRHYLVGSPADPLERAAEGLHSAFGAIVVGHRGVDGGAGVGGGARDGVDGVGGALAGVADDIRRSGATIVWLAQGTRSPHELAMQLSTFVEVPVVAIRGIHRFSALAYTPFSAR